jgi:carbon-monoxide dehydrogenase catalytic subunit
MAKDPILPQDRVTNQASLDMLEKAEADCVDTCFARFASQGTQCKFGVSGVCCKICHMGPCRITPKNPRGICGADEHVIVARNFLREVVGGAAAHSDHGRHLVLRLKAVAEGKGGDYRISDRNALLRIARKYDIPTQDRSDNDIALDVANTFLAEYTAQEETLRTLELAPLKQQGIWEKTGVALWHRPHVRGVHAPDSHGCGS